MLDSVFLAAMIGLFGVAVAYLFACERV